MEISNILKNLRVEKGLTQKELAQYLNIGQSTVNGYEKGNREPVLEIIKAYSKFFNVSTDYLLGMEDDFGEKIIDSTVSTISVSVLPESLSPEERKLIVDYRKLDKVSKRAIERTASSLAEDSEDKMKQLFGENKR